MKGKDGWWGAFVEKDKEMIVAFDNIFSGMRWDSDSYENTRQATTVLRYRAERFLRCVEAMEATLIAMEDKEAK